MLMSVALTLMMMLFVVQIFGLVGQSVDTSRAVLEMNDQLRSATDRLRKDLQGATADMNPPLSPEAGKGYFEIIEGPIGPVIPMGEDPANPDITDVALNTNDPGNIVHDSTVTDKDDILMFTSRSRGEPFVGRSFVMLPSGLAVARQTIESPLAEIVYFVRGTTLYRRILLIKPEFDWNLSTSPVELLSYTTLYGGSGLLILDPSVLPVEEQAFYNNFDLSVRLQGDPNTPATWVWVPNTLADLTKRENRFAHQPTGYAFPHHPHMVLGWPYLGLPTLRECSWCVDPRNLNGAWWPGRALPTINLTLIPGLAASGFTPGPGALTELDKFDSWNTPLPLPFNEVDPDTGTLHLPPQTPQSAYMGPRVAEDVLLTNVIGFDVKVWDPGAPLYEVGGVCLAPGDPGYIAAAGGNPVGYGAYVDLGYPYTPPPNVPRPWFNFNSANSKTNLPYVYDTWSNHYEKDGIDQDLNGIADQGTDGFDGTPTGQPGSGVVDSADEQEAPAPYARPLRGIQIKIRMFEPDSRRVREVTIVHDFLSE